MPKTSRRLTVHPLSLRKVQVARIEDVTPGMRRITLTGDQLGEFTSTNGHVRPAFTASGFDDDIRLFFTPPGHTEPVLPTQNATGLKRATDSLNRVYSVRRWDPHAGELDVDFVKHGTGAATTWAYRAQPGDEMHFVGPRASKDLPTADWLLVAGDDTAVPAIGRLLEELPDDARALVFIEIAEETHIQHLRELPGVTIAWLSRNGADAGTTSLLLDAVREAQWLDGAPFAWVAGEQAAVRDIRRHLVEERGMDKADIEFTGYWRRTEVVALADDAAVPDPQKNQLAFTRFHDLAELVPPIALRAAAGLGLGDLISRGVTSAADLAARSGSDERALRKLLRYLESIEVLKQDSAGYRLTEVGEYLASELFIDVLHPDGVAGRQTAGVFGLAETLRTGKSAYASVTGQEYAALRTEQWFEDKLLEKIDPFQRFFAAPLAQLPSMQSIQHLVIHSAGAGAQARELVTALPHLRITICALPAQADWLRRDLVVSIADESQRERIEVVEQSIFQPSPVSDGVLIVRTLGSLPDADASFALRQATQRLDEGGAVLLIEETLSDDLDEHETEADLLALTRDGTGVRTEDDLQHVIAAGGLDVAGTRTVGWETTVLELTRGHRHHQS